jgi:hypothetical protein
MEAMRLTNLIFPRTGNNEFDQAYNAQQQIYVANNSGMQLASFKGGRPGALGGFTMRPSSQRRNVLETSQRFIETNPNVFGKGVLDVKPMGRKEAPRVPDDWNKIIQDLSDVVVDKKATKGLAGQLKKMAEQSLKLQAVNNATPFVKANRDEFVEKIDEMEAEGIKTNNEVLIEEAKTSRESLKKNDDAQKRIKDDEEARKKNPNLPPCDTCIEEAAEALLELMPKMKKILNLK